MLLVIICVLSTLYYKTNVYAYFLSLNDYRISEYIVPRTGDIKIELKDSIYY